jgi:hypothetical protein
MAVLSKAALTRQDRAGFVAVARLNALAYW